MLGGKTPQPLLHRVTQIFMFLKEYPNKQLLARSKIQKFKSKEHLFQLRSALFTQVCILLLKAQTQKRTVYVSRQIYQNVNGCILMLYSFDPTHQDRLLKISTGQLLHHIIEFYYLIFGKSLSTESVQLILDCQLNQIYQDSESLIAYLTELNEKSQDYYFGNINKITKDVSSLASPLSIQKKLQNSAVFKEYSFSLKCSTAVLAKFITNSFQVKNYQASEVYLQLLHIQQGLFRSMNCLSEQMVLKNNFEDFTHKFLHLLKLMQADNYIKLITFQEEKIENEKRRRQNYLVFQVIFIMNLKKLTYNNKTAEEGSQSQGSNQFSIEQKERTRQKDYLQTLHRFKNEILFKLEVTCQPNRKHLNVSLEAQCRWIIESFYFNQFQNLWMRFFNFWHSSPSKEQSEGRINRWQLFHRQRHPLIMSRWVCYKQNNLAAHLIRSIDEMSITFLLFENVLKNLWKSSQALMEPPTGYLTMIQSQHFIQSLASLLRATFQQYWILEEALDQIHRKYSQP